MLRGIVLVGALLSISGAMAQDHVLNNLPTGVSSPQAFFTGSWCTGAVRDGAPTLVSCGPRNAESSYSYAPDLRSGIFDIYVRWVEYDKSPTAVPIMIHYSMYGANPDGSVSKEAATDGPLYLNQAKDGGTWWYLGRYSSVGGPNALGVTLIDDVAGNVSTEGARFVRVGGYPPPKAGQ